ncbi:MAG TPA: hypothetical protein ENJ00_00550 [Phycisphaerales bacterium]|nr:hypothetical protein [Phycisphaerales bacterium]
MSKSATIRFCSGVWIMKDSRFTEEQIAFALRRLECVPVREVCRRVEVSGQIFGRWKVASAGIRDRRDTSAEVAT